MYIHVFGITLQKYSIVTPPPSNPPPQQNPLFSGNAIFQTHTQQQQQTVHRRRSSTVNHCHRRVLIPYHINQLGFRSVIQNTLRELYSRLLP